LFDCIAKFIGIFTKHTIRRRTIQSLKQITQNIELITNVTQQSATGVRQIAHAAEELSQLTSNLQSLISAFKVDGNMYSEENIKSIFEESFLTDQETSIEEKNKFFVD